MLLMFLGHSLLFLEVIYSIYFPDLSLLIVVLFLGLLLFSPLLHLLEQ